MVLRLTDLGPFHYMVLLFIVLSCPEESGEEFSDLMMEGFMQIIESHYVHQKANKGGKGVEVHHSIQSSFGHVTYIYQTTKGIAEIVHAACPPLNYSLPSHALT